MPWGLSLRDALRRSIQERRRLWDRLGAGLTVALGELGRAAAREALRAQTPPRAASLLSGPLLDAMGTVLMDGGRQAATAGAALGMAQTGVPGTPDLAPILAQVGERITRIDAETRARVQTYVGQAVAEGYSPQRLARLIAKDGSGAFAPWRAKVIARTETAVVYNQGSLAGYRASGRVEKVQIFDGDDCGWTSHDDPDGADGSIRTLDDAEEHPIAHPNCVRSWAPVVG